MAITLGQILGQVRFRLAGLGAVEDAQAELKTAITASDLTLALDETTGFSRGVAEIDLELVRVKQVDSSTATLTLPTYGRGYKDTTATTHAAGVMVGFNPLWPKSTLAQETNGVLSEIYPALYAVTSTETTVPTDGSPVTMPTGAIGVISVWLEPSAPADTWYPATHWDFRPDADNALSLGQGSPGQAIRIVYATRPELFDLTTTDPLSQDFETVTGLQERMADVIALGVAARLAPFVHLSQLSVRGAEARADGKEPSNTAAAARLLYSEFQARVQSEQMALVKEHPIRPHKIGR